MESTIIKGADSHEKELEILVPWDMIEDDYKDILKQYLKLPVKGFRPGKTPVGAIESFFKNQIKNDLLSVTSTRLCRRALKDKGLIAGSPIELTDSELMKNVNLKFRASFIEMPQFDLPDYFHLDLESTDGIDQLNEISEKLLNRTTIAVPSSFIENELKYSESEGEIPSEEERMAAEDRVRLMLILKKIANQDNVEINDRDVDDRIRKIAEENEVTHEQLKEFLIENGGFSRLADSLLAERVLQYIISAQG